MDGIRYGNERGILRLLDPARTGELQPFIQAYKEQRAEEGWGAPQPPEYYLNLPYKDTTGRHAELWKLRARHMSTMFMLLEPVFDLAEPGVGPLILDAGAGNCWLSYRLAEEKARPIALDINDDPADGLGVAEIYRSHARVEIVATQGELERLPIVDRACDAVVINGSLHYASDTRTALSEAWRVLRPQGKMVVMDSPVYQDEQAGEMMRAEWREGYIERHGHSPAQLPGRGYLTYAEVRRGLGALSPKPYRTIFIPQYTGLHTLWRSLKLLAKKAGGYKQRELATHPIWAIEKPTHRTK